MRTIIVALFCLAVVCMRSALSYAAAGQRPAAGLPFNSAASTQKGHPGIEVTAAVDRSSIQIGDKITYTVTVMAPKDIEVEFPRLQTQDLAGFTVKESGSSEKGSWGKQAFTQWYRLDTYVSGEHTIPAAAIKYRIKGSADWQGASVHEVKVEVKSVLDSAPARSDIRDIRGPKGFAGNGRALVFVAIAVLLVAGAVFLFVRSRKRKREIEAVPPAAHIIAYEALAALGKKDYIRKGHIKAYYIELSDIVRHYLENRFTIRAPEMTTEEFLMRVKEGSALSLEHKALLREFLVNCDLVKFATYQPAEQEANASFASAKTLIDQTKQEVSP